MANYSSYDVLVFDMEDALVDQSVSLGTALSRAVDTYMTALLGVAPEGGPVFTFEEVRSFVESQDFETDVDVLHALLVLALHSLSEELSEDEFRDYDGRELLDMVKESGKIKDSLGDVVRRKNLPEFLKMLRQKGGGKRGFSRIRGLRNQWLALAEGHIMMDNFVKRVLAEVYLGEELFQKEYGRERQFVQGEGAIGLEKSWLDVDELEQIRKRCPFAVITSRSQAEAQSVLDKIGMAKLFDVVVSQDAMGTGMADLDEVMWIRDLGVGGATAAEYSTRVMEALERIRAREGMEQIVRVGFVGNCAKDGRGVNPLKDRYRLTAIGCVFGQDKKILNAQREKGADVVVTEPAQLFRVLNERPRMRASNDPRRYS